MTKEELASKLNGMEYRTDIPKELIDQAKENGLVIVYGYSDDLMEFEGALELEGDCYKGQKFLIALAGQSVRKFDEDYNKFIKFDVDEDELVEISYDEKTTKNVIEAVWCSKDNDPVIAWTYKTEIPHDTFEVMETDDEESEVQCIGIVFNISDLQK